MALQTVFHNEFSNRTRGLGHFADSNCTPLNQSTIFHPTPIVAILLKYLLSHVVQLFQQCHSFWIDDVLKFNDTLLILQESQYCFLLELVDAVPRWMFSDLDLLQGF